MRSRHAWHKGVIVTRLQRDCLRRLPGRLVDQTRIDPADVRHGPDQASMRRRALLLGRVKGHVELLLFVVAGIVTAGQILRRDDRVVGLEDSVSVKELPSGQRLKVTESPNGVLIRKKPPPNLSSACNRGGLTGLPRHVRRSTWPVQTWQVHRACVNSRCHPSASKTSGTRSTCP